MLSEHDSMEDIDSQYVVNMKHKAGCPIEHGSHGLGLGHDDHSYGHDNHHAGHDSHHAGHASETLHGRIKRL